MAIGFPRSTSCAIPINCVTSRASANTERYSAPSGHSTYGMSERLSGEKRIEVGDHAVLHRDMRLNGMTTDMRGQHDIRKGGQRIRRMRFAFEHIQAGAGDGLVGQRRDQRRLIDHGAARDVDDVAVLAELAQY